MKRICIMIGVILVSSMQAEAFQGGQQIVEAFTGLKFRGRYFLSYQIGEEDGADINKFAIRRGYSIVEKTFNKNVTTRLTMDVRTDETGDLKMQLKYLYAHVKFSDWGFVNKPNAEIGLVHSPWNEFQNAMFPYRLQNSPYMSRAGILTSADYGVSVKGYFKGEMDNEYRDTVNSRFAGYYGSFSFGVYNGGGFRASEMNTNKVFQVRLTLRPLPKQIKGLQLSYLKILGRGNLEETPLRDAPDWKTYMGMVSYESSKVTVTAQYFTGEGNLSGTYINDDSVATDTEGYSFAFEGKWHKHWRFIGWYDFVNPDKDLKITESNRFVIGIGYQIDRGNLILLDFDREEFEDPLQPTYKQLQLTWELRF